MTVSVRIYCRRTPAEKAKQVGDDVVVVVVAVDVVVADVGGKEMSGVGRWTVIISGTDLCEVM